MIHHPTSVRATLKDVALLAQVSHQTVSRVVNDHASVRALTRDRVLAAMAKLNYQPSQTARALSASRSRTIGVLAAASGSRAVEASIAAVERAARERGYWVSVASIDPCDPHSTELGLDRLRQETVEAIVLMVPGSPILDAMIERRPEVPHVSFYGGDDRTPAAPQIAAARRATRHLLELGHWRIAHIRGPEGYLEADARMLGFVDELRAWGTRASAVVPGDWTSDSGFAAASRLLDIAPDTTAVFAANDQIALGAIHAARERGRSVPDDLSIVGFDDLPEAAHYRPALTTVHEDFAELGRRSVGMLLGDRAAGAPAKLALAVRGSTAAPPSPLVLCAVGRGTDAVHAAEVT